MRNGLGQMAAGGTTMRVVVTWEGRPVLLWLGGFIMSMVAAVAVMMSSNLHSLVGTLVHIARSVGMAPRSKQTVGQMQEDCNNGDDFEGPARHGFDSRQSAAGSQLQLSCITTPPALALFSGEPTFYDDPRSVLPRSPKFP